MIKSSELRKKYIEFFINKDHKEIKSASIVPENDPTVLFTTAGMHPLVPYLMGEVHPFGKRLTSVQKCIRTSDIDEVGDNTHLTFFEMLGNWSLGDYFKNESIEYSYEFLTEVLKLDKERLYFSVFKGDEIAPFDEESYNKWLSLGISKEHINILGKEDNFWILGSGIGPCGPDTEIFYETDDKKLIEIWNNVFMEYNRKEDGTLEKLKNQNVDTGMGLERTVQVLNGYESVYDTDLFENLKFKLEEITRLKYENNKESFRIIMDHIRTSVFILGDDLKIIPSNTERGYVLRRLLRRTIRHLRKLNVNEFALDKLASVVIEDYKELYNELDRNKEFIMDELTKEYNKFSKTIKDGEKLFYKSIKNIENNTLSGSDAFKLFDTFGFPIEMTLELAKENNINVDVDGFNEAFKNHQEKSKTLDKGAYKGGLADQSIETVKYHTAAHLLLAALQKLLGEDTVQKGANITSERLRFDFNCDHKLTDEEKEKVENLVNEMIKSNTDVYMKEMTLEEAIKENVHGTFMDKYNDVVKVYIIGDYSKEICGGPHVNNTNELGEFKIVKEESSSSGVRRIKAILK